MLDLIGVESVTFGMSIRKRESIQIHEDDWKESMALNEYVAMKLLSKEEEVIKAKALIFMVQENNLVVSMIYDLEEGNCVEGSGLVSIQKPGMKPFGDISYEQANFFDLEENYSRVGRWSTSYMEVNSSYKQEEFLQKYLENGHLTVEVSSEICVNRESVEDKNMKRNETFVSDINKFVNDKTPYDFMIICKGKEIPCHRMILCSRCPMIADGLAANMSEETFGRWTVTDSNPEAVRQMLHFLYTGEILNIKSQPTEILHLASFYRLPELESASKEELVRRLTAENAVKTLVNIDKYAPNDSEVKENVIGFIKKNALKVVKGEDWSLFSENYAYLVTDIVKAMAN